MPSQPPFILADNVFDRINLYPQAKIAEPGPASILLKYSPGDTITGENFSRATTASYIDASGNVAYAAINAKRDNHWVDGVFGDGIRRTLLEGARTNLCLQSAALDVSFSPRSGTFTPNFSAAPDTTSTAEKFTPANNTSYAATAAIGVDVNGRTFSISVWMRVAAGTKSVTIGMLKNGDAGVGIVATVVVTTTWQRFVVTGTGNVSSTSFYPFFQSVADTTAFEIWGFQVEEAPFVSSYIPTTTVAVTRAADSYDLPFTPPPQEMTVYAKFKESGSVLTAGGRVFEFVNSAAGANPRFLVQGNPGVYGFYHNNGVSPVNTPILLSGPALGDGVELNTRLFGDGSVDITQSLNGAASTAAGPSSALALAPAWSGQLLWLNSEGSGAGVGFVALQSFKIVAGARSLAEMRGSMSSPSVVGREVNYAEDYRRERTYYQAAATAANQGLVADLGAGNTQLCDSCWIDRGHNLWGKTVKIWAGGDGIVYPETLSLVVPALGTVGGDPATGWCVTEEGAIYTLFTGFTARQWWKVTVTESWQPIFTGVILGKRVQLSSPAGYSSVLDEDAGERSDRRESSMVPGYEGEDRQYSARKVELRLAYIGATEYDAAIRGLRRTLYEVGQAAVVCMNYGTKPERTWLYKYRGKDWSSPTQRSYRSVNIPLFEYGPLIR